METDVEACFDQLPHSLIGEQLRRRIVDKRVLGLVRSFLKAGVMTETGSLQRTMTGTPQGGIASPLLANIALSALDREYLADWEQMSSWDGKRRYLQKHGHPTYRLIRYADDLVLLVKGTEPQARSLLDQLRERVQALGLTLKSEKTAVTHIDDGFVFLGQRIIRRAYGAKPHVYTFVTNEALASIKRKVKALTGRSTTNLALSELIAALNPVLRGWGNYYRHAAAKRTFCYLDYYVWWRVGRWLRKKHPRMTWKQIQRRFLNDDYTYQAGGIVLHQPARTAITRYRYRGARIPNPWTEQPAEPNDPQTQLADREEQPALEHIQQALG